MANVPDNSVPFLNERTTMQQVELEKVFLYTRSMMTELMSDYPGLSKNAKIDIIKHQAEGLVFTMTSWCAAGRIPDSFETEHIEWPKTPWQMFKNNHFPEWFLSRFPVKMEKREIKKTINHYFVCPHIQVPDDRQHIQFMVTGTKSAERMNRY